MALQIILSGRYIQLFLTLNLLCSVRIELKHSGNILAANTQQFFSDGSSNTFHVFFDHPVQIEVRAVFTIHKYSMSTIPG